MRDGEAVYAIPVSYLHAHGSALVFSTVTLDALKPGWKLDLRRSVLGHDVAARAIAAGRRRW